MIRSADAGDLDAEQIEHVAVRAAEIGRYDLETWCDAALHFPSDRTTIARIVEHDADLTEWLELGARTGYRKRAR